MTNIKKMLGAGIAVATLFGFAACGSNNNSSEKKADTSTPVQLTVWGSADDQKDGGWIKTVEEEFKKDHPNVTFKNAVVEPPDAAKAVKQDAKAAADVFLFPNDQLGDLVKAGAIGELSDAATNQVKEQNEDTLIKSVTAQDGKMYGVPYTGNTWFMYYNKAKFSADDVKSLDTMLTKGKVSFDIANAWYLPGFYLDGNMTLFGENGNDAKAGMKLSDKAGEVTKYLANLVANKNFVLDGNGRGLAGLKDGSVDAYFSGSWDAAKVKDALKDNYAAAALPKFKTESGEHQMKSFAGSKAVAYNTNTKSPEMAATFAAFLGSKKSQQIAFEKEGAIPSDKSLADSVKAEPAAVAQMETIAKTSVLQPAIPEMGKFWDPVQAFGTGISTGKITPANAAAQTAEFAKGLGK
ncbi:extracellular solute-binding protein [Gardnerella vaginalis]|uniref:ABC transporter substrate-binding protein n=1 Tax=Gardnerella vaginalis TaxID=2702 RepID=A0A2K1STJ6_GARVA|nr:extracellular solute-binding protein [Gardnerella vaginalis]PNS42864.1 ABC transporter substrate-binding protein [Gardnerella vaginalis]